MPDKTVAFLGTGLMGAPMAANLLKHGFAVRAWNRTRDKAEPLAAAGATVCDAPDGATAGAGFVISMLADTHATDQVLFESGLCTKLAQGTTVIVMSSLAPEDSRRHAKRCKEHGIAYLDAPVSGGPGGARDGTLAIMAGGDKAAFDRCAGVFAAMGRATLVGPAGSGQLAKLANQIIVGCTIVAVSEALLLAERGGANADAVREALKGGFADSRILQVHGQRMTSRKFAPGATVTTQLKDMDNILREAKARHLKLPSSELTRGLYAALADRGLAHVDHAGAYLEIERLNGIARAFSDSDSTS
jgi:2-hydroxy-3-oxopropionate reductase